MTARDLHAEVRTWVEQRAAEIGTPAQLNELVRVVDDAISADIPEVGSVPALREILDLSTRTALVLYLHALPREEPGTVGASPEMRELARGLALRGVDLTVLLRLYRVGQRAAWHELMRVVHDAGLDDELRIAVLDFLWDGLSRNLEHVVEDVVESYTEEAEQRLRGSFARRAQTIETILAGDQIDSATATAHLGHPLQRTQTAAVLWLPEHTDGTSLTGRLERAARQIGKALGAPSVLTFQHGDHTLWAWLATERPPRLERVAGTFETTSSYEIRVALGEPAPGLTGFRSSHHQALRAHQVATAAGHDRQVTRYADVELVSMLAADQEAMCSFVARALGGLAGNDMTSARLRATLLAYYATGSSSRAADSLNVHKNTVLYRLPQVEQLLGHRLSERRLEVETALRLVATYGVGVLTD